MGNVQNKLNLRVIQDKTEAQRLLDIAEKQDFYLEECHDNNANMLARRNLAYYPNSILPADMKDINSFIETVKIPTKLYELDSVSIIQLMPTADGGMPHTRPDIICYPVISFSDTTLIHELWHVHQRRFQLFWSNIFKQIGWTVWQHDLPERLEKYRRYNPDTIDSPLWIFKNTWVPVPIFMDITHPSMSECEVWFYNINGYHVRNIPKELSSYFEGLHNIALEHPREITAYMLAEPKKFRTSPAFKDLIKAIGYTAINHTIDNTGDHLV